MTEITEDHVEWAVVGRLRLMLKELPKTPFNVTQSYALFAATLCWVVQRIRVKNIETENDRAASVVRAKLSAQLINDLPWVLSDDRIARVGSTSFRVPPSVGFCDHSAEDFFVSLRNAVAHGD